MSGRPSSHAHQVRITSCGAAQVSPPAQIAPLGRPTLSWEAVAPPIVCHAALAEQGYGEDLDMVVDGDEEEVAVMLAAVEGMDGVKLPIVKKFKRELAKLRGQGERF